jgi:HPt (histidine-containing phosphotransfer) domain-containing protein
MSDAFLDPVDMAKLRQRFDDDAELLAEIFRVFVSEVPGRRANIEAALASGDLAQLMRLAHSLKGVSGTLFAEPLRLGAYDLELAARTEDHEQVERLVAVVLERLDAVAAYFGQRL